MNGKKLMFGIAAIAVTVSLAFAQVSGNTMNRKKGHSLNTAQTRTIEGSIVKVDVQERGIGRYGTGVHLVVKEGNRETEIHLGPKAYIESAGWMFKAGDKIKMTAFSGTYGNSAALFAAEITANGKTLVLRDKQGFPEWRASQDPNLRGQGRNNKGKGRGQRGFKRGGRANCCRAL